MEETYLAPSHPSEEFQEAINNDSSHSRDHIDLGSFFHPNEAFSSFEEFNERLQKFLQEDNCLIVRASESIEFANRHKKGEGLFETKLKYRYVRYACKYSYRKITNPCPVHLHLRSDRVHQVLRVASMEIRHNHPWNIPPSPRLKPEMHLNGKSELADGETSMETSLMRDSLDESKEECKVDGSDDMIHSRSEDGQLVSDGHTLRINETFMSFAEFNEKLRSIRAQHDLRIIWSTPVASRKNASAYNPQLVYTNIKYVCRQSQSLRCPVHIHLSLCPSDHGKLFIRSLNLGHNHPPGARKRAPRTPRIRPHSEPKRRLLEHEPRRRIVHEVIHDPEEDLVRLPQEKVVGVPWPRPSLQEGASEFCPKKEESMKYCMAMRTFESMAQFMDRLELEDFFNKLFQIQLIFEQWKKA